MVQLLSGLLLLYWFAINSAIVSPDELSENGVPQYDVIIVGCGAAGLAALGRLVEGGARALCLEAESQVGGRIRTQRYGTGVAEFGAEWVHGNNVVVDIARKSNISFSTPQIMSYDFIMSNGSTPNKELSHEMKRFLFAMLKDVSSEPAQTMELFMTSRVKRYIEEFPHLQHEREFCDSFIRWFSKHGASHDGANSWKAISTKGWNEYRDCNGPLNLSWGTRGYQTLIDVLLGKTDIQRTAQSLDIKLDKEVIQINWFPTEQSGRVLVRCADGSVYTAKTALVTISVAVLQERYKTLFKPMVPPAKIFGISLPELGIVDKVILHYDHAWWGDVKTVSFLWMNEDIKALSEEKKWLAQVYTADVPEGSENLLTFWVVGEVAKQMEVMDTEELKKDLDWLVLKFFSSQFPILPTSMELRRSTWYSNPHFRGSYSYHDLRSDGVKDPTRGLRDAIYHPTSDAPLLLFAGEATHQHYFSTVHGAIETGWREADRILQWRSSKERTMAQKRMVTLPRLTDEWSACRAVITRDGASEGLKSGTSSHAHALSMRESTLPSSCTLTSSERHTNDFP